MDTERRACPDLFRQQQRSENDRRLISKARDALRCASKPPSTRHSRASPSCYLTKLPDSSRSGWLRNGEFPVFVVRRVRAKVVLWSPVTWVEMVPNDIGGNTRVRLGAAGEPLRESDRVEALLGELLDVPRYFSEESGCRGFGRETESEAELSREILTQPRRGRSCRLRLHRLPWIGGPAAQLP